MSDQVCLVVGSEIMGSNKYLNTLFKTAIVIKVMETFFFQEYFKKSKVKDACFIMIED